MRTIKGDNTEISNLLKISNYRPEIDGLRAFAVISVIINHFNKDILPSGYLGVDIFFVISGYVITSSLNKRSSKDFKDFIASFFTRRIKRIIPALAFFIIVMSVGICLFNPLPRVSLETGLSSLFGLSNLYLFKASTNYFSESSALNIFTHTWSLGVEEQFYVIFPFLAWFSGFSKNSKNGFRNLFLIIGGLTIFSFIIFIYFYPTNQPAAYFLMPARFWEISAGCLVFIKFAKKKLKNKFTANLPQLFILFLIICIMLLPVSQDGLSTFAIVILTSIFIASSKKQTVAFKLLTNPKVIHIGKISYSLYLWHWGVLTLSKWTIGVHWWTIPLQLIIIFSLGQFSFRYIEEPFRKFSFSEKRWKEICIGGIIIFLSSINLLVFSELSKRGLYLGRKVAKETIGGESEWKFRTPNDSNNISGAFNNCHLIYSYNSNIFPIDECTLKGTTEQNIYFMGNSHSEQYREMQRSLREIFKGNIISISVSACTFPSDFGPKSCKSQGLLSKKVLESSNKDDIIVVINRYPLYDWTINKLWTEEKEGEKDMINLINEANKKGVKVIIFGPTPEFPKRVLIDCDQQWFRPYKNSLCITTRKDERKARHNSYKVLSRLSEKGALIFYPIKYLCIEDTCHFRDIENSRIIYPDGSHISTYGIKKFLKKPFFDFISSNNLIKK